MTYLIEVELDNYTPHILPITKTFDNNACHNRTFSMTRFLNTLRRCHDLENANQFSLTNIPLTRYALRCFGLHV